MPLDSPKLGSDHFCESARRVVDHLNQHTALTDWSVTRVSGDEQVQVHVHVHMHMHEGSVLAPGLRAAYPDNFCMRMINGAAPVVADTQTDPDYAGVRLTDDQGQPFGVLCGFGIDPLENVADVDADLLNLMGDLLSTHLSTARTCMGDGDRVARYGGDEFVILSNSVAVADLPRHFGALVQALEDTGIAGSYGFSATRRSAISVVDEFVEADLAMCAAKTDRQPPPTMTPTGEHL